VAIVHEVREDAISGRDVEAVVAKRKANDIGNGEVKIRLPMPCLAQHGEGKIAADHRAQAPCLSAESGGDGADPRAEVQ
jgi:hypothetical protein